MYLSTLLTQATWIKKAPMKREATSLLLLLPREGWDLGGIVKGRRAKNRISDATPTQSRQILTNMCNKFSRIQDNNALTPVRTTNGQSFRHKRRKAHGIKWGGECGACFELRRAYHLFVGQRIHQSEGEEGAPLFGCYRLSGRGVCVRRLFVNAPQW